MTDIITTRFITKEEVDKILFNVYNREGIIEFFGDDNIIKQLEKLPRIHDDGFDKYNSIAFETIGHFLAEDLKYEIWVRYILKNYDSDLYLPNNFKDLDFSKAETEYMISYELFSEEF